jgi:hypothetical protein
MKSKLGTMLVNDKEHTECSNRLKDTTFTFKKLRGLPDLKNDNSKNKPYPDKFEFQINYNSLYVLARPEYCMEHAYIKKQKLYSLFT